MDKKRIAATLFIYFLNFYDILYRNGIQVKIMTKSNFKKFIRTNLKELSLKEQKEMLDKIQYYWMPNIVNKLNMCLENNVDVMIEDKPKNIMRISTKIQ